jgi:hypothetical protein
MGATKLSKDSINAVKFHKLVRLRAGNEDFGWKVTFEVDGENWEASVIARHYLVSEPNPTGVRVTLKNPNYPTYSHDWCRVAMPTDEGEVRLLVALTLLAAITVWLTALAKGEH